MDNIEIIGNLVAVEAVSVGTKGKFSYTAVEADGTRHPLAGNAAPRENVFFYTWGNLNGNNKVSGALNGHCSYGTARSSVKYLPVGEKLIRGIKVNFI